MELQDKLSYCKQLFAWMTGFGVGTITAALANVTDTCVLAGVVVLVFSVIGWVFAETLISL